MAGEMVLYDSLISSNIPKEEKSQLRRWFEGSVGSALSATRPRGQVKSSLSTFRLYSESLLAGAILGAINVEAKNGLDIGGVPVDAAAAGVLGIASALAGDSELAPDARNIGAACSTVFSFRQTTELLAEKRRAKGQALPPHLSQPGAKVSGDVNVSGDPIVQAAKNL